MNLLAGIFSNKGSKPNGLRLNGRTVRRLAKVVMEEQGFADRGSVLEKALAKELPKNYAKIFARAIPVIDGTLGQMYRDMGWVKVNAHYEPNAFSLDEHNGARNDGNRVRLPYPIKFPTEEEILQYMAMVISRKFYVTGNTVYKIEELTHPAITTDYVLYILQDEDILEELRWKAGVPKGELRIIFQDAKYHLKRVRQLLGLDSRNGHRDNESRVTRELERELDVIEAQITIKSPVDEVGLIIAKLKKWGCVEPLYERGEMENAGPIRYGGAGGRKGSANLKHDLKIALGPYMPNGERPSFTQYSRKRVRMTLVLPPETHAAFQRFCQDRGLYNTAA